jgi:large subunit ribosomal protein L9
VTTRDLADAITAAGFSVSRAQVALTQPIKEIGVHPVAVVLHPEVSATVTVNVARSQDEAERQARGEDLTVRDREPELEAVEVEAEDGRGEPGAEEATEPE